MSFGLWCAGVDLEDSGRLREEGQVETYRTDGPRAVQYCSGQSVV